MPNVTSKFLSYDNEAAKYDLVEFKDQCFKVFCSDFNKLSELGFKTSKNNPVKILACGGASRNDCNCF